MNSGALQKVAGDPNGKHPAKETQYREDENMMICTERNNSVQYNNAAKRFPLLTKRREEKKCP